MKALLDRIEFVEACLQIVARGDPLDKEYGKAAWNELQQIRAIAEILPDHIEPDKLRQPPERVIELPGK